MISRINPTPLRTEITVTRPLDSASPTPTKVKSSAVMVTSIRAVYGARAICRASMKIGFAYPISRAKIAALASSAHGFSASVTGPPKTRNNCQTVIRNSIAQAVY